MDYPVLSVPIDAKTFEEWSIEDISVDNFAKWINFVYPRGFSDTNTEIFEDLLARMQIFEAILRFWSEWLRPGTEQPKTK